MRCKLFFINAKRRRTSLWERNKFIFSYGGAWDLLDKIHSIDSRVYIVGERPMHTHTQIAITINVRRGLFRITKESAVFRSRKKRTLL